MLLADGNIAEALALLPAFEELHAKHPASSSCSSTPILTWSMVAKGLIDAASDNLEDAADALSEAFDGLLATDDRFIALRVGIDLAVLHARLGSSDKAHDLLRKLMAWGAEANMPSFVLDHDRRIVPILLQARDQGVFDEHGGALKFVNGLLEQLRERAREKKKPADVTPARGADGARALDRGVHRARAVEQGDRPGARCRTRDNQDAPEAHFSEAVG